MTSTDEGGDSANSGSDMLARYQQAVREGVQVQPGDTDEQIQQKLRAYNDAVHFTAGTEWAETGNLVSGAEGSAPAPARGGGHYAIDPNELDGLITQWQDLVHKLENDSVHIERIANAGPPANDTEASAPQAKAIASFGERMHDRNQKMLQYAQEYVDALKKTQQAYQHQEHNTQTTLNQQAR